MDKFVEVFGDVFGGLFMSILYILSGGRLFK